MNIYTLYDCIVDLYEIARRDNRIRLIYDYDELLIRIRNKHNKKVAIRTIMDKFRKLKKLGVIRIIQGRHWDYGIVYSDKAKVLVIRSKLYEFFREQLTHEKTITLEAYLYENH